MKIIVYGTVLLLFLLLCQQTAAMSYDMTPEYFGETSSINYNMTPKLPTKKKPEPKLKPKPQAPKIIENKDECVDGRCPAPNEVEYERPRLFMWRRRYY